MSKLPVVSGRDAVRAFGRFGYEVDHQTGSHIIFCDKRKPRIAVSPYLITGSSPRGRFVRSSAPPG